MKHSTSIITGGDKMQDKIQQKILNLISQGITDYRSIQDMLKRKEVIEVENKIPRTSYSIEIQLRSLALKYVSPTELLSTPAEFRKQLIASRLLASVQNASTQDRINETMSDSLLMLTLDGQITTSMSDPNYAQEFETVISHESQTSWLEQNGFSETDIPSKYELLELIEQNQIT